MPGKGVAEQLLALCASQMGLCFPIQLSCFCSESCNSNPGSSHPIVCCRPPERCSGGPGVHPQDVRGSQSRQRQNNLLSLHVCHRYRKHPFCFCCCQGHHLAAQLEGIQPRLTLSCLPLSALSHLLGRPFCREESKTREPHEFKKKCTGKKQTKS